VQSNGKKKPRPRRSFTPEFKADIVARCLRDDNGRVAANLTAAIAPKEERDAYLKGLGEMLVRMSEARRAR